jgi:L-methionine (R)-S-oxide reductase
VTQERPAVHGDALNLVRAAIAEAPGPAAAAQRAVELLHDRFPHYDWVGVYWVSRSRSRSRSRSSEGADLVLGPWVGPEATDHVRIPIGTGVCGAAAASGTTEIVPDVSVDQRYVACFASTQSEIVVPIFEGGAVVGAIDADGSDLDAFDDTDAQFLEEIAALLAPLRPRP